MTGVLDMTQASKFLFDSKDWPRFSYPTEIAKTFLYKLSENQKDYTIRDAAYTLHAAHIFFLTSTVAETPTVLQPFKRGKGVPFLHSDDWGSGAEIISTTSTRIPMDKAAGQERGPSCQRRLPPLQGDQVRRRFQFPCGQLDQSHVRIQLRC